MLFNPEQTEEQELLTIPPERVMTGFVFDWETSRYVMEQGTPKEADGTEAVKAWLQQIVRTARGRYAIYNSDFGAPAADLIGRKNPAGFGLSELRRQLTESARYLPAVLEIGALSYDGRTISGAITMKTERGIVTEVIDVGP